ncbi:Unannotated [Lentimonas sp. CC4]|nr:Unannotated [Lentimonas sp. CC4]CAA6687063.1 Unannotated [Lentimonas sp. CC6]CAA7076163.1 Unannotated [Lentimonas sp. CC4]CAA7171188.1 Unannotated [Lentimonas sp. CC21]CAA7182769.1 Unannotated [Lentimonas sp. CC8]
MAMSFPYLVPGRKMAFEKKTAKVSKSRLCQIFIFNATLVFWGISGGVNLDFH